VGPHLVVVPERDDLLEALGVSREEHGLGHVVGTDLEVILNVGVRVFAVVRH